MIFEYILSIIILVDLTFVGLIVTYFFGLNFFLEVRLAVGTLISLLILGFLMLGLSFFIGLNFLGLIIFLLIINLLAMILWKKSYVEAVITEGKDLLDRFKSLSWKLYYFFIVILVLIFGYLASQLLTFDNSRYFVQPPHAYGDISLHLGIISSFAFGNNFPPQSPIFAGEKISYPFLVDFITALFVNPVSLRLDQSIALVGVLLMTILIIILSNFSLKITGSKLATCLVLFLVFFNGGLGFLYFFSDLQVSNLNFFQFIQSLPRDYTALKDLGYYWINIVLSMFLPQRSFLLGLPVSILILYIFWDLSEHFDIKKLLFAILLIAGLPLIHAHSLIALAPFLLWLSVLIIFRNKKSIIPFVIFGLIGICIVFLLSKLFLQQASNPISLMQYKLGWMAPKGEMIPYYIKNFGIILFLIPLSIYYGLRKKMKLAIFALIGQVWFILPSLFLFQPWDYDNTKLFIYWYLSSIFIVSYFLSKLILFNYITAIILAITVLYVATFAGSLDIIRLITSSGTKSEVYSPQAIGLAEFVKKNIEQDAVFLSIDKFDNPVVALAGRKVLVGFHGWLWTYGLDFSQKDSDIRKMLSGEGTDEMLKKYNISYVIFFEKEQNNFVVNDDYFINRYQLIYNQEGYKIFKI